MTLKQNLTFVLTLRNRPWSQNTLISSDLIFQSMGRPMLIKEYSNREFKLEVPIGTENGYIK